MEWKFTEAQNRLSEVIDRAIREGPQVIRRRHDAVVIVAADEFERMSNRERGFKAYLFDGPSLEGVELERDRGTARDIDSAGTLSIEEP